MKPIRANLRTFERNVTDVRACVSDALPPSAALPLCKGENLMSPLQRGTAAKRQGVAHTRPSALRNGECRIVDGSQERDQVLTVCRVGHEVMPCTPEIVLRAVENLLER